MYEKYDKYIEYQILITVMESMIDSWRITMKKQGVLNKREEELMNILWTYNEPRYMRRLYRGMRMAQE